jgi:hypothetical protein
VKNKLFLDFICEKKNFLLILIVVVVAVIIFVGIYFTRFSPDFRLFRISGESIGEYKSGSLVIAKKVSDPLSLKKGDAVLYTVGIGGNRVERLGLILALPSESKIKAVGVITLDQSFLVGKDAKVKDLVEKNKIDWVIIKKF